MRSLPAILLSLLLAVPAFAIELFRYRVSGRDGGTLEYVFATDVPNTVTKEKIAEIAVNAMTTIYGSIQVGALEAQELSYFTAK